MNVGLYSFKTMELEHIINLKKQLNESLNVDKIYLYFENDNSYKVKNRKGLKKLMKDYEKNRIDIIALENFDALGKKKPIIYEILKDFQQKNYNVYIVDEDINTLNKDGMLRLQVYTQLIKPFTYKISTRIVRDGEKVKKIIKRIEI